MRLQTVAVVGAGGFIGSAVCRALVQRNIDVNAVLGPPGVDVSMGLDLRRSVFADISTTNDLDAVIEGVDVVVHLAGPPSVARSFQEPASTIRAHVEGTANVLECARRNSVERFVYISSAEVYGRPRADFVGESHPLEARSPYAAAKVGAEQVVRAYGHAYGIRSVIVRPFSVYGAGMGGHSVFQAIIRQVLAGAQVSLANPRPVRDFCHVTDVAEVIVRACALDRGSMEIFNIGTGIGTSVGDLALRAFELAGHPGVVCESTEPSRPSNADIFRLVADVTSIREVLDWAPAMTLDDGIREMLEARK